MGDVVKKMVTGDTLVIELAVDNDDGEVTVVKGDPYQYSTLPKKEYVVSKERRTWEDAEESCAIAGALLLPAMRKVIKYFKTYIPE